MRALAIRTLSNINFKAGLELIADSVRQALHDPDPYVVKTAAVAVGKIYFKDSRFCVSANLLEELKVLLQHSNSMVVANTVAILSEIAGKSELFEFSLDFGTATKLLAACDEASEWSQIYILESIMSVRPDNSISAETLAERITPRLQHGNTAIILACVRILIHLINFISSEDAIQLLLKKLGPPLITLLNRPPEIQFTALKNIQLIIQKHKSFASADIKVFFCKYDDPIYVKLAKLEILYRLANADNIHLVLPELKEYASEVDVDFVSKSVRAIGRCAIKIDGESDRCVECLVQLIQTKVNYIVQEAIVVIKDIFRKYPNRYESIIGILCENLESLELPEAKASLIWVIGQYADRIENADQLLEGFLENFSDEETIVQLSLLTAIVKLFIKRPKSGQELVPKVLKLATENVENPDLRDRGYIYWRLLSTDPVRAKVSISLT